MGIEVFIVISSKTGGIDSVFTTRPHAENRIQILFQEDPECAAFLEYRIDEFECDKGVYNYC